MYGEMKNYDSAIANYEKAKAIDSAYISKIIIFLIPLTLQAKANLKKHWLPSMIFYYSESE